MKKEYKGYFYGTEEEKEYYEGGAHFSYQLLVMKLLNIQKDIKLREQNEDVNLIHSNIYERSKRHTKCRKIIINNGIPLNIELNNKNILILQKEFDKTKDNSNDNGNYVTHKKSHSFTKAILKSRNMNNNNKINANYNLQTQQIKRQTLQQPMKLTIIKQKGSFNQNKSHIQNILIHDHALPKLNLKYPSIGGKENNLNLNLFKKGNISSRNRISLRNHNSRNTDLNSLKFLSIDDKQFKNVMKGYNKNVPITERKHSIKKMNNFKEMYKLDLNEYKTIQS